MKMFGKKKKESSNCCGGNCNCKEQKDVGNKLSDIKILGSGCANCNALEKSTVDALKELNLNDTIEHITDFAVIASYGVMSTPALVVDGKVVSYGKVLKANEIVEIIKRIRNI